jgi:hypothetical protein
MSTWTGDVMTWTTVHRRGEVLRAVADAAADRRDGRLPMDVEGAQETFGDELGLLAALSLRWHTRLAGHIERQLMDQPTDLEQRVVDAWHATADELPGIRAVLDRHRAEPRDAALAEMLEKSVAKERVLLAMMAGRASAPDDAAARAGARIEQRARASYRPRSTRRPEPAQHRLLDRIRTLVPA